MKGKERWQKAIIGIVLASIMLASVLAAMVPTGSADAGDTHNIIIPGATNNVLMGQKLEFQDFDLGCPIVGRSPEEIEGMIFGTATADYDTKAYFTVAGMYFVDSNANGVYDVSETNLAVCEPVMDLDLKVRGKSVNSIAVGTLLEIDFTINLRTSDTVNLRIIDPSGCLLKNNPTNASQEFDNINVSYLLSNYGRPNGIDTAGWGIGTYTFCIKTEEDKACGLDMSSNTKTLTILKAEIEIDVPRTAMIGEDVTITVTAAAGDDVDIVIGNILEFNDEVLVDGEAEVEWDTAEKTVGSYTIEVYVDCDELTADMVGMDVEDEIDEFDLDADAIEPIRLIELGVSVEQLKDVVAAGDDYVINGIAIGVYEVDIVIIGPDGLTEDRLGIEEGLCITSSSVSDNEYEVEIWISDDSDPGDYVALVLSPGRDGDYGNTRYGDGELEDALADYHGVAVKDLAVSLKGKNQAQLIDIIADATFDQVGSDDDYAMLTFRIESPYIGIVKPIASVVAGEPLEISIITNREDDVVIIVYSPDCPELPPATAIVKDGIANVTIDTTGVPAGTCTLEAEDEDGNTDTVEVEIVSYSYPGVGDWVIESGEDCVVKNRTIVLNGNLTINGNLTFENVTLEVNATYNGSNKIEVTSTGSFKILDYNGAPSNITAVNDSYHYLFWANGGSKFMMNNSQIYYCGYNYSTSDDKYLGLWINTNNTVLENVSIVNNFVGIVISGNGTTTTLNDTKVINQGKGAEAFRIRGNNNNINGAITNQGTANNGMNIIGANNNLNAATTITINQGSRNNGIRIAGANTNFNGAVTITINQGTFNDGIITTGGNNINFNRAVTITINQGTRNNGMKIRGKGNNINFNNFPLTITINQGGIGTNGIRIINNGNTINFNNANFNLRANINGPNQQGNGIEILGNNNNINLNNANLNFNANFAPGSSTSPANAIVIRGNTNTIDGNSNRITGNRPVHPNPRLGWNNNGIYMDGA